MACNLVTGKQRLGIGTRMLKSLGLLVLKQFINSLGVHRNYSTLQLTFERPGIAFLRTSCTKKLAMKIYEKLAEYQL